MAALVAFGVLLLAANLYVQSQGAQQRIRQTLTEALHVPVSLKKTTLTPWEGLRLDGIILHAAPPAEAGAADRGDFMTVDSFRVRIALWPLLRMGHVVVESILLDHPKLAWAQNTQGRWVWPEDPSLKHHKAGAAPPRPTPEATDSPAADDSPPASPDPAALTVAPVTLASPPDHLAPVSSAQVPAVPWFRVRHGWLDLLDGRRKLLGHLEGVDLDGELRPDGHAEGDLRCERAALARPALRLMNFQSGFTFDEAAGLSIDGGTGELAGGVLQVDYKLLTQEPGSPFSAECRVKNVDLSELLHEAGSRLRLMEGRLQGGVHVEGSSDDPARTHATGQLRLIGAQVRNFPVLQLLGDMLQIKDLSHLEFKTAEVECRLDGDDLQIDSLRLVSNDLQILAQGRYATGKDRLDLHSRLIIDSAVGRQLPQFIEMNFSPCGDHDPGCRYMDFDVAGPVGKPTTNLFDRVLAGQANGLLQNLLAPKPKKARNKVPKAIGPTPTPAPAVDGVGS